MPFCRWTARNSEFRIALSKSFRPRFRVHRWGSVAAMPGRRMAFIRRILNYTVHRARARTAALPHWVTFSPECIYNGYYIEPAEKRPWLQREIQSYRSSVSMNSFSRAVSHARSFFIPAPISTPLCILFLSPFHFLAFLVSWSELRFTFLTSSFLWCIYEESSNVNSFY